MSSTISLETVAHYSIGDTVRCAVNSTDTHPQRPNYVTGIVVGYTIDLDGNGSRLLYKVEVMMKNYNRIDPTRFVVDAKLMTKVDDLMDVPPPPKPAASM